MYGYNEQAGSGDWNSSPILLSPAWPVEHEVSDEFISSPLSSPGMYTPQEFDSQDFFDQPVSEALHPNAINPLAATLRYSPPAYDPQLEWTPDWTQGNIYPIPPYVPLSLIHDPLSQPIDSTVDLAEGSTYYPSSFAASPNRERSPQSSLKPAWQTANEPASRRHSHGGPRSGRNSSHVKEKEGLNSQPKRASMSASSKGHQLRSTRMGHRINYSERETMSSAEPARTSKTSHNMVEKQYRTRLNGQFSTLLEALPVELVSTEVEGYIKDNSSQKKVSKSDVLILAKRHIQILEREKTMLEDKNGQLAENMQRLKGAWVDMGGQILP